MEAFNKHKKLASEEPMLRLPNHSKSFKVHTDSFDFAIGEVLVRDGHSITYKSRKLNDIVWQYTVQEKEMLAVVRCLRIWRHYLLCTEFIVKTDNVATRYFQAQKLSPKQVRWQEFLAEFNMCLEYKPGKENRVADVLSRKVELAMMCQLTQLNVNFLDQIRMEMAKDPIAQDLLKLACKGKT